MGGQVRPTICVKTTRMLDAVGVGYFENMFPFLYVGQLPQHNGGVWIADGMTAQANGITDLAWVNILMGNATTNFVQSPLAYDPSLPLLDPTNPIPPRAPMIQ